MPERGNKGCRYHPPRHWSCTPRQKVALFPTVSPRSEKVASPLNQLGEQILPADRRDKLDSGKMFMGQEGRL